MYSRKVCGFAVLALAVCCHPVMAQTDSNEVSTNRVAVHTDWSVFEHTSPPKRCWIVSQPEETVNTRDGRVVSVRRGEIRLFVHFSPEEDVNGEVSFIGGYPFREGVDVKVDIGGESFSLFTFAEMAWTSSDDEDRKLVEALKRGRKAVVTGVSSRGTKTKETFSLSGITAAIEDAEKRCNG